MNEWPPYDPGSRERAAWERGATEENHMHYDGMTNEARQLADFIDTLARQGRDPDHIVSMVAYVFTAEWTWRRRLALCRRIITGR